ncbi:Hypothetical predicted protein, partial [Olea europaea subsp. europaea]
MSGHVVAKVGTEPDFKAILGSFMDTVCKPCPGYGRDASRLPGIFRRFLELDVQAMFGMHLVHDKDATWVFMKSISLLHDSKLKNGVESSSLESGVPTLEGFATVVVMLEF